MNDIRIRNKFQRPSGQQPAKKTDLSFLQENPNQPKKPLGNIKAPRNSSRHIWLTVLLAIILLTVGILLGRHLPWLQSENSPVLVETTSDTKPKSLFDVDLFYKIDLIDGTQYFSHVAEAEVSHYRLTQIFYTSATEEVAARDNELKIGEIEESQQERITLVKYGTEQDRTADELLVPREQVTSLSPLNQASPVLEAIENYLQ